MVPAPPGPAPRAAGRTGSRRPRPRRAARGAGRRRGADRPEPAPLPAAPPAPCPWPQRGSSAGASARGEGGGPRDHAVSRRQAKLRWKMNNAGKCAALRARFSAARHLFPGADSRRAVALPPVPASFLLRLGAAPRRRHRSARQPAPRAGPARPLPRVLPGSRGLRRGPSAVAVASRGLREDPGRQTGRAVSVAGRGSASDMLALPQSPWEICCDFLWEVWSFGVVFFAVGKKFCKPKPFLLSSVNFPEIFPGGNRGGERDWMKREEL